MAEPTKEELHAMRDRIEAWPRASEALETLLAEGCSLGDVLSFLVRVEKAGSTLELSSEDLLGIAARCRLAAMGLRKIRQWGEHRNLDSIPDPGDWLNATADDLDRLKDELREETKRADIRKGSRRLARAKARFVAYVVRRAKQPRDPATALLISVALGPERKYDAESHRKWRERNLDRLVEQLRARGEDL